MATTLIKRCLVCNCDDTDRSLLDVGLDTGVSDLFEKELTVVMLLRKILDLRKTFLVSILQNVGESPSLWNVKLCRVCYRVFEEVKFVWSRLKALEKEFESLSNVLKAKLRESSAQSESANEHLESRWEKRTTRRNRGKFSDISKGANKEDGDAIASQIRKEFMHRTNDNNQAVNVDIKSNFQSVFTFANHQSKKTTATPRRPMGFNCKVEPDFIHSNFANSSNLKTDINTHSINLAEEDHQMELVDNEYMNENDDFDIDQEVASNNSDANSDTSITRKPSQKSKKYRRRKWRGGGVPGGREKGSILQGARRDDNTFICPRCEKTFLTLPLCDDHILNDHYDGKWPDAVPCHLCDLRFKRKNWLRVHVNSKHPGEKLPGDALVDKMYEMSYSVVALDAKSENLEEEDGLDFLSNPSEVHLESLKLPMLLKGGDIREIALPLSFFRLPEEVKAKFVQTSEKHPCDLCSKIFPTVIQYESHLHGTHHEEKNSYGCPMCSKKYEKIQHLIVHIEGNHTSNNLNCPKCGRTFKEEILLNGHVQRVHYGIENPYKCIKCGMGHSRRANLNIHLKNIHKLQISSLLGRSDVTQTSTTEKKPSSKIKHLPCETCLKENISIKFASQKLLNAHLKRKHNEIRKRYQCTICTTGYNRPSQLEEHMNTHTVRTDDHLPGLKPQHPPPVYLCNPCNRLFKSKLALEAHLKGRFHENVKPYVCEICSQSFTLLAYLNNHQAQKHHEELKIEPLFKCSYCDKILNTARNLNDHTRLHHTKNAKYKCPYSNCNVQAQFQSVMKLHINVRHTKVNKHLCPHCPKIFSNPQYLNNHLRIHTGEKPHECNVCFKKFADKSTCNRHIESHAGIVHICPHCSKSGFKTRHALGVHIKTHEGISRRTKTKREHPTQFNTDGPNQSFEPEFPTSDRKTNDTVNFINAVTSNEHDQFADAAANLPEFEFKYEYGRSGAK